MPTLFALTFQLAVAGVLLASAVAKTRSSANEDVWRHILAPLSRRVSPRAASHAHVAAEFAVGTALLLGPAVRGPALAAATLMMAAFTLFAAHAAWTGRTITCSCFGRSSTALGWPHAARNLVLTAMAVFALAAAGDARPSMQEAVLAGAAALVVVLVSVLFDDIVHLFRGPDQPTRGRTTRSA